MDVNRTKNGPIQHIGILGGMGPRATLRFYEHVITYAAEKYGAKRDDEFPQISLESIALPGFTASNLPELDRVKELLQSACARLEASGAAVIVVPCNTVQAVLKEIVVGIPIINLIEETAREAKLRGLSSPYLAATHMTYEAKLYDRAYEENNPSFLTSPILTPSQEMQQVIENLITSLEEGDVSEKTREAVSLLIREAEQIAADHIVLGCTELSLIPKEYFQHFTILDSSEIGARALVDFAYASPSKTSEAPQVERLLQLLESK